MQGQCDKSLRLVATRLNLLFDLILWLCVLSAEPPPLSCDLTTRITGWPLSAPAASLQRPQLPETLMERPRCAGLARLSDQYKSCR